MNEAEETATRTAIKKLNADYLAWILTHPEPMEPFPLIYAQDTLPGVTRSERLAKHYSKRQEARDKRAAKEEWRQVRQMNKERARKW